MRVPDVLLARIDTAASGERTKWILEACRMRLDKTGSGEEPQTHQTTGVGTGLGQLPDNRESSALTSPTTPNMAALREICAGNLEPHIEDSTGFRGVDHPIKPCVVCDSPMREVKGKWACVDQSCGMYGKEQKPR